VSELSDKALEMANNWLKTMTDNAYCETSDCNPIIRACVEALDTKDKQLLACDKLLEDDDETICKLEKELQKYKPMYRDLAEYEHIVGFKVNELFTLGWNMARLPNSLLQKLEGESE